MQNHLWKNHNASVNQFPQPRPQMPAWLFTLHQNWEYLHKPIQWMNPHTPKKHVHIQLSITFYKPLQMCEHILRHADPALPLMVAAFVFLPKTLAFDSWLIYNAALAHFRRMIASGRSSKNCAVSQKHHKSYWCRLYCDTTSGKSPSNQTTDIISRRSWDEWHRLLRFPQPCRRRWLL